MIFVYLLLQLVELYILTTVKSTMREGMRIFIRKRFLCCLVFVFRVFVFSCLFFSAFRSTSFSQPLRQWQVAFMPNVNYAFPDAVTWLNNIKSDDFKINVAAIPDTIAGPIVEMKMDAWLALEGEYDPEQWELLSIHQEKIQIHFWPMTRGKLTNIKEIKDFVKESPLVFYDPNDLISRTCYTIYDALETLYEGAAVNIVPRHDLKWPPFNEFRQGDKMNTIILPLLNYNPHPTLLKVIKFAKRQSIDIPNEIRAKFFEEINNCECAGSDWPLTRISDLFFPGSLPRNFLGLKQRQLWPVQTTAKVVLLVSKNEGNRLNERDRNFLLQDIKTICTKLSNEFESEMRAEYQSWQNAENLSNPVNERVWKTAQKSRWALILSQNQQQIKQTRKKLSRFIRDFLEKTKKVFGYHNRVRFRELDYLLNPKDFWAINNLIDIYNKVGNYAGARIIGSTIIDEDIKLKVDIPYDSKHPIKDPQHQYDEHLAAFLENYALALENLKIDPQFPRFVRKVARDLRQKWTNK